MTIFEIVKNRTIFDIVREKLLTEDKHSNYHEGDRVVWKSGVYEKTKHGWVKVPGQKDGYEGIKAISDVLKTKKPLTVQNSNLNYGAKSENKVLSDFTHGECFKDLDGCIDDVFISDSGMKIACPEVNDSSVVRSNNNAGGQIHSKTGNCNIYLPIYYWVIDFLIYGSH